MKAWKGKNMATPILVTGAGRAIAKTVGVSEATVRRILRGSRVNATKAASHAVAVTVPCV
jgi:DNA-binding protein